MKTVGYTETIIKPTGKKKVVKIPKSLSLDDIEEKMMELINDDSTDVLQTMINETKLGMLEKVANFKLHRLQLKALEQQPAEVDVKPITVQFISAKTDEQKNRLERIDREILEKRNIKQDA